jgi:Ca-activated chloride channel family protein
MSTADNGAALPSQGADAYAPPGGEIVPPPGSEEADPSEESAFVATESDPFSTFGADVDTASYDLFRSNLANGWGLPDPSSVRTEDFVNYFDYEYEEPAEGERPFTIDLAATSQFLDAPTALLRVGIQAAAAPPTEKRPANLAFLIDVSGSMQDSLKLPLVKRLLTETLEVLEPDDRVSLVTYASGTGVALPSTPVSERSAIEAVITDLSPGGATNGAGGIQLAYEQIKSAWIEGGINHVVLCTDGDFNVGVSSTSELVKLIENERKSGITFTAVGFGAGPNDAMLEQISNHGNGIYGAVGTEAQATEYAHERMLGTLYHVAKDMKIQVEFNPELVVAYRLLGYENRAIADDDFRDDFVDAGEVGAGHRVTALYELALESGQLPEGETPSDGETSDLERSIQSGDLVLVRVRYKDVGASEEDAAHEVKREAERAAEALAAVGGTIVSRTVAR